jgi:hypothetical protein
MGYVWFRQVALRSLSKWSIGGRAWCLKPHSAAVTHSLLEPPAFLSSLSLQPAATTTNRGCLFHLFSALGALLVALDGDVGWRWSAATGDHVPVARDKDSVGHLLVGGVLDDDIMELPSGVSDDVIRSS